MPARNSLLLLVGLAATMGRAQYEVDTAVAPLPTVCDVFLLPGGMAESMYAVGIEQWRMLAPSSELLARDLSDYKYDNQNDDEWAAAASFAVSASLRIGPGDRTKRSGAYLRAGIAYQHHRGTNLLLRNEIRTPYDTLTSSQTGQSIAIDSLSISTYEFSHAYKSIALDASFIFLKEYPRRWSLYGGGGVSVGATFDGRMNAEHSVEQRTDPVVSGSGSSGTEPYTSWEQEEVRTKDDLCVAMYLPLGVTYRLSKKHPFWSAINLAYEMRPTFSFGGVPELDLGARANIIQYFGLRIDLVK